MKKYRKIYIEITNRCNLNCSFCPKTKRKLENMSADNFSYILQQVKDRCENLYLHVMGEPTSHPQLAEILSACRENNVKVNITTNGTLLDTTGNMILENKVKMVSVSLHSFEANSLDKSMQTYLDKVITFAKKSLETDTICELRLWNFDRQSIYDKNRLNAQIIDYLQKSLELDFNLRSEIDKTLLEIDHRNQRKFNIRLKNKIFLGMAEHFDWPDIDKPKCFTEGFCYGLRNQVAILVNGDVVPCCLDSEGNIVLGNIFEDTLEDIINGGRAQNLYNNFSNRKVIEPLCQTCGYMKQHIKR